MSSSFIRSLDFTFNEEWVRFTVLTDINNHLDLRRSRLTNLINDLNREDFLALAEFSLQIMIDRTFYFVTLDCDNATIQSIFELQCDIIITRNHDVAHDYFLNVMFN